MKTISLDNNNNILLDSYGNIAFKENSQALAQDIANELSLCLGENPYNTQEGINYDDDVLGVFGGYEFLEEQFKNRILENEEVITVSDININYNNNQLQITSNINSIYGAINV